MKGGNRLLNHFAKGCVLAGVAALVFFGAVDARADFVLNLTIPSKSVKSYQANPDFKGFASINVDLAGGDGTNTALITVTAADGYFLGGTKALDLSVNGTAVASNIDSDATGKHESVKVRKSKNPVNVDAFGKYDLVLDSTSCLAAKRFTTVTFTLTKKDGVWNNEEEVLDLNNNGYMAAGHVYIEKDVVKRGRTFVTYVNGYGAAKDGTPTTTATPLPGTILLLAPAIAGIGALRRKYM